MLSLTLWTHVFLVFGFVSVAYPGHLLNYVSLLKGIDSYMLPTIKASPEVRCRNSSARLSPRHMQVHSLQREPSRIVRSIIIKLNVNVSPICHRSSQPVPRRPLDSDGILQACQVLDVLAKA